MEREREREGEGMRLTGYRTTRSDWLAWESAREPVETAIPAF